MIAPQIYAALASLAAGQVYPVRIPQGKDLPAITYTVIDSEHLNSMDGYAGLSKSIVQIDSQAVGFAEASALLDAAKTAIRTAFPDAIVFAELRPEDELDGRYIHGFQFSLWHS